MFLLGFSKVIDFMIYAPTTKETKMNNITDEEMFDAIILVVFCLIGMLLMYYFGPVSHA